MNDGDLKSINEPPTGTREVSLTPNSINEPKILPTKIPTMTRTNPTSAVAGTTPVVAVIGTDFIAQCVIVFNDKPLSTTFVDSTKIQATFPNLPVGVYPVTMRLYGATLPKPLNFTFT